MPSNINKDYSRGFKLKLYPTESQKAILDRHIELFRYVYNWGLKQRNEYYKSTGQLLKTRDLMDRLSEYRNANEWLQVLPLHSARLAIYHLDNAFNNFFKYGKGYPKFKSKKLKNTRPGYSKSFKQSVHYRNEPYAFNITENGVRISGFPREERIACKSFSHIPLNDNTRFYACTISFDGFNYWLSVNIEVDRSVLYKPNNITNKNSLGIDLGVVTYAKLSNGKEYKFPKILHTLENRRRRYQGKLMSRNAKRKLQAKQAKTKLKNIPISKNTQKLSLEYYKLRNRIKNIKNSFIHRATTEIANLYPDRIVMEDLNQSDFRKWNTGKYYDFIVHSNWYKFREYMEYKCIERGIEFVVANRSFPSTQLCSGCGNINYSMDNRNRLYKCKCCGLIIDRDLNAAINLSKYSV